MSRRTVAEVAPAPAPTSRLQHALLVGNERHRGREASVGSDLSWWSRLTWPRERKELAEDFMANNVDRYSLEVRNWLVLKYPLADPEQAYLLEQLIDSGVFNHVTHVDLNGRSRLVGAQEFLGIVQALKRRVAKSASSASDFIAVGLLRVSADTAIDILMREAEPVA